MPKRDQMPTGEKKEAEPNFQLESNPEFLDFQKVEVTSVDESKPWKPAKEVRVTKKDGSAAENLDASTPFFTFKDKTGNEMTVSAEAAGHIDNLHIKGQEAGSKFDYDSLEGLFKDVAEKLPEKVTSEPGVSAFAIDMGKKMGAEGVATMEELARDGFLEDSDIETARAKKDEVIALNAEGTPEAKKEFIDKFKAENPDCKVQFQLVRGNVLVPVVDAPKRPTTELFQVWGPGANGKKTVYTMAPGRFMPKHPNPEQHKDKSGKVNQETFKESADAWFDTVMLTGK